MTPDLSTWLTKDEAAERLGMPVRSFERLCEEGNGPEKGERPGTSGRPRVVFNPRDVERLTPARKGVMVPAGSKLMAQPGYPAAADDQVVTMSTLVQVLDRFASVLESRLPAPAIEPPQWLTIEQASARVGLSPALLKAAIRAGKLPAIRDRASSQEPGGHGGGNGPVKILLANLANFANSAELAEFVQPLKLAVNELRKAVAARKAGRAKA